MTTWHLAKIITNEGIDPQSCWPEADTTEDETRVWGYITREQAPDLVRRANMHFGDTDERPVRMEGNFIVVDLDATYEDQRIGANIVFRAFLSPASAEARAAKATPAGAAGALQVLTAVQKLQLQAGDVLVMYLGDPTAGYVPSPDDQERMTALGIETIEALGLDESVAVLAVPYWVGLEVARGARPEESLTAAVGHLRQAQQAIEAKQGIEAGQEIEAADTAFQTFVTEAERPAPASPLAGALEQYTLLVERMLTSRPHAYGEAERSNLQRAGKALREAARLGE